MQPKPKTTAIILGLILLIATLLRMPFVYEGSPYFYREDEAHHYNRIVNMLKSGNLDPDYFHKPSLHFYLRLPSVAAGFLYSVKKAEIKDVKELNTVDSFGIADYSFSASHPRVLHISRAFSLAISLAVILLTFILCQQLQLGRLAALGAAMLLAISPAAISESAVIGVDGPMTFFALWSVYLALRAFKANSTVSLFWCAAACGLCVSCKYNALPIFILPYTLLYYNKNYSLERCLTAIFVAPLFFLLGSPYLIFSIPKFLNQFGFEIWHYGVAGHVGHMSNPGFDQLKFYLSWLARDAIGIMALTFAVCGSILLLKASNRAFRLAAVFPTLFFVLMLSQKANFERNMLAIIPFACILSASVLNFEKAKAAFRILFLAALIQPLIGAMSLNRSTAELPESRIILSQQIAALPEHQKPVAVDGTLQLERRILQLPNIDRVNFTNMSAIDLFQHGYKTLISSSQFSNALSSGQLYNLSEKIEGIAQIQRVVQNPEITVLTASKSESKKLISELNQDFPLIEINLDKPAFGSDGLIWIDSSIKKIKFVSANIHSAVRLVLFSPWDNQKLTFQTANTSTESEFNNSREITVDLPTTAEVTVLSEKVISPVSAGISSDNRRLAFAIKSVVLR